MRALACAALLLTGCPRSDAPSPAPVRDEPSVIASGPTSTAPVTLVCAKPPPAPHSFKDAKRLLRDMYAKATHATLYAGCPFSAWKIDWSHCCLKRRGARARLEWEHVVPASAFGRGFPEWTKGHPDCVKKTGKPFKGRKCATRTSEPFRHMEGDMHNLMPSIGTINQARSWFPMGLIEGEQRDHGSCDVEVQAKRFEPRPAVRGDIARAYLYMADAYPDAAILDGATRAMVQKWHQADPPDAWERERNGLINNAQGNLNPWISH